MSQRPADSSVRQMGAALGNGEDSEAEPTGPMAGAGERAAAAAREARMAEAARLLPEPGEEEVPEGRRSGNGAGLAALPHPRLRHPPGGLGIDYQQFLLRYMENYRIALNRIQDLRQFRWPFVEGNRAQEVVFGAIYQRNPPRMDVDMLAFTVARSASEVINPLIEELGCDKFINRE